jgi:hypothetical protein
MKAVANINRGAKSESARTGSISKLAEKNDERIFVIAPVGGDANAIAFAFD